jgi:hypothetical protein
VPNSGAFLIIPAEKVKGREYIHLANSFFVVSIENMFN